MNRLQRVGLVVAVAIAAAGCGGKGKAVTSANAKASSVAWKDEPVAPSAFPAVPPFVAPGERMAYRLSLHGLEVASFVIVVGELDEVAGRKVAVVQSGVQSSRLVSMLKEVNDNFTSWIDAATSAPIAYRSDELASADDQNLEVSEADLAARKDGKYPVVITRDGTALAEEQVVGDATVFDLNGFLIAMRAWDPPQGTTATADVVRSRFVWRTQVTLAGYEDVVTELGELPAVRIDGVSRWINRDGSVDTSVDPRHYSLWISDDADRVPLVMVARTDYGDVKMEIVEYVAGTGARLGLR